MIPYRPAYPQHTCESTIPANSVVRQEREKRGWPCSEQNIRASQQRSRSPERHSQLSSRATAGPAAVCAPMPLHFRLQMATVDGRKLRDDYLSFYAPKFLIPISCSRLSVVMSHFLIRTRSATIMQQNYYTKGLSSLLCVMRLGIGVAALFLASVAGLLLLPLLI